MEQLSQNSDAGKYDYVDESGNLIFQVIRKPGKKFRQRRPAQKGETSGEQEAKFHEGAWWMYSMTGITTVPYHCDHLANTPRELRVVMVEGEKDADNLAARERSIVTTTMPGGASRKWEPSWTQYFKDRDVIISPDCDAAGLKHAQKIVAAIYGVAARVRVVDWDKLWPDRPKDRKLDVSDWLEAHPDEQNVVERLHAASEDTMPAALRDLSSGNGSDWNDNECAKCADQAGFELYWEIDGGTSFIYHNKQTGQWSLWPESKVKGKLREKPSYGNGIDDDDAECVLRYVMDHRQIDLQLPSLSGYPIGLHALHDGRKVLIRSQALKIVPAKGDWSLIEEFLKVKFDRSGIGDIDLTAYVYGWLWHRINTLCCSVPGDFAPGLCLVLVGKASVGKSFIQNHIIHPLLGHRSADPEQYLSAATDFNSELFSAEHLKLEDPQSDGTYRSRLRLGQGIKKLVATEIQRCHPKNRVAIMVKPFFGLTISINDSRESLAVLPALDPTVTGKLLVLPVAEEMGPMPTRDEQRRSFCEKLESQLPAFAYFLLHEFELPNELKCPRFGLKGFIHPSIASELFGRSPQAELLIYIDGARWGADGTKTLWDQPNDETSRTRTGGLWYGTAARLEDLLVTSSVGTKVERILRNRKLVNLLSDLEEQTGRVIHVHDADHWRWMIEPPPAG